MNHGIMNGLGLAVAALPFLGCAWGGADAEAEIATKEQLNTVADGALQVVFTKTADWGTGYNGQFEITNVTASVISGWNLYFTLPAMTTVDWCYEDGKSTPSCGPFEPRNGEKAKQLFPTGAATEIAPGQTLIYRFGGTITGSSTVTTVATCQYNGFVDEVWEAGQIPCDGSADVNHPGVPSGLVASAATETTVSLSWDESTDLDVVAYRVYGPLGPVVDVTSPGAIVSSPSPTSPSFYRVSAIDGAGNISVVSPSVEVNFIPQSVSFTAQTLSNWQSGYQGEIVLTNEGSEAITGWRFDMQQAGISSLWNANWSTSGSNIVVTAPSEANTIAPGASVSIGYVVSGNTDVPEEFSFRGATCPADGSVCVP